jgi:diguanylate cyclase (GGDEF)-like protein
VDEVSGPAHSPFARLRDAFAAACRVRTARELDATLDGIARLIGETLGYRTVVINVHRPAWDDFIASTVHGDDDVRAALLGTTHSWAEWAPLLHDRFTRRGAQIVLGEDSAAVADRVGTVYTPARTGSSGDPDAYDPEDMYLVVMRDNDGDPVGILSVDEPVSGRRPGDDAIDGLVTVAGFAGLAIAQAQEAARVSQHRAALEHLLTVSSRIADARSSDVVQRAVCNGIRDALGFERVSALLADAGGRLRPVATAGWDPEDPALQITLTLADFESLMVPEFEQQGCFLVEHDTAARILGVGEDGSYRSRMNGHGPLAWYRHWLVVPLRGIDGSLRGLIWADDPIDRLIPSIPKFQALRLFADQALAALEAADHLERTQHLAEHDALTGLPNRALLLERLRHALSRSVRSDKTIALLFLDLDRFKAINDTWGHEAGDLVLRTTAARIDESLRPFDTVARLGGDEFVVLCEDVDGEDAALEIARRLRASLTRPIDVLGDFVTVSASVGVALPDGVSEDPEELLHAADTAMYRAKRRGRGASEVASPALRAGASAKARVERTLRGAIGRGEIHVYYQPIVDLTTGRVDRAEALLRWEHPSLGWISPLEFIPLAEESGQIIELGRHVLAAACRQHAIWRDRFGDDAPGVSVNLSPRQLRDPDLVEVAGGMLARDAIAPGKLAFEITESVLLDGDPETRRILQALRGLGAPLQLDDFGTGYSSLGYLRDFPVDGIKIDRAFVGQLHSDPADRAIVEAVVLMARALHLHVVAEGVERTEQRMLLEGLGISLVQGFLFSRPGPAADMDELLGRAGWDLAAA